MITVQMAEKIAEMAKIDIKEDEIEKVREELSRMIGFAKEISEIADSIEIMPDEPQSIQRSENRAECEMDRESLSEYGMHIKGGFFRIEAGARK